MSDKQSGTNRSPIIIERHLSVHPVRITRSKRGERKKKERKEGRKEGRKEANREHNLAQSHPPFLFQKSDGVRVLR